MCNMCLLHRLLAIRRMLAYNFLSFSAQYCTCSHQVHILCIFLFKNKSARHEDFKQLIKLTTNTLMIVIISTSEKWGVAFVYLFVKSRTHCFKIIIYFNGKSATIMTVNCMSTERMKIINSSVHVHVISVNIYWKRFDWLKCTVM